MSQNSREDGHENKIYNVQHIRPHVPSTTPSSLHLLAAIWYTSYQGVLAVANLTEELSVTYLMAWEFKSFNGKNPKLKEKTRTNNLFSYERQIWVHSSYNRKSEVELQIEFFADNIFFLIFHWWKLGYTNFKKQI